MLGPRKQGLVSCLTVSTVVQGSACSPQNKKVEACVEASQDTLDSSNSQNMTEGEKSHRREGLASK